MTPELLGKLLSEELGHEGFSDIDPFILDFARLEQNSD